MEEENINSAKELLKSLGETFDSLKSAMKEGDEEKFNNLRKISKDIIKEIEETFSSHGDSDETKKDKKIKKK